jgi:hypothetical protein
MSALQLKVAEDAMGFHRLMEMQRQSHEKNRKQHEHRMYAVRKRLQAFGIEVGLENPEHFGSFTFDLNAMEALVERLPEQGARPEGDEDDVLF